MTLLEAINNAADRFAKAGITSARFDAELLLSRVVNKDRAWLITHIHDTLDDGKRTVFEGTVDRRARREPLQYIVGTQEFWGLEFRVSPDVLIPRPETELLVETALAAVKEKSANLRIIDLCTGSGCVAVSLANELPIAHFFATDKSGTALIVAGENARRHSVSDRIRFLGGDLFGPLEELDLRGQVDIITANPPYIPSGELPALQAEVRDYEPEVALIAGREGTEIHRRIIDNAPFYLKHDGMLIMEMGVGQAEALTQMITSTGTYDAPEILKDLAGIDRVVAARKKKDILAN